MIQQFILSATDGKFLPIIYYNRYGKGFLEGKVCGSQELAENFAKRMSADALRLMLLHYVNHREKAFQSYPSVVSHTASIHALREILREKQSLERTCEMFWNARYHIRNIMPSQQSKFFAHQSEFVESLITYCFNQVQTQRKNESINL